MTGNGDSPVNMDRREVIYEFHRIGNYMKVSAIDCATGEEVSIVGDRRATDFEMRRIALRKLGRRLAKVLDDGGSR